MATFYLDYEGGSDAADGTTFANRWKTITGGATAARIAPGDIIRVMASLAPTSLGINATWTKNSPTVTLASALNVLIDECESAWTGSTNITSSTDGLFNYRSGSAALAITFGSAFTTGKAAYKDLGGSNDYSGYQGITFWLKTTVAIAASTLSMRLCSDTTGDTTVDTLVIPAISQINQWVPIWIDTAGALGSAIQSIALYADADPGTPTVYIDNISTTKAAGNDCLTLASLIGKNTTGEVFWGIRRINGTALTLDQSPSMGFSDIGQEKGYHGTTESVTTYKLNGIYTDMTATSTAVQEVQDSGSSGSPITFSGGWDRTNMSTQDGETHFDGRTGAAYGIYAASKSYVSFEKIHLHRYDLGMYLNATSNFSLNDVMSIGNCLNGLYLVGNDQLYVEDLTMNAIRSSGIGGSGGANHQFDSLILAMCGAGNAQVGWVTVSGAGWTFGNLEIYNSNLEGMVVAQSTNTIYDLKVGTLTIEGNGRYGLSLAGCVGARFGTVNANNNGYSGVLTSGINNDVFIESILASGNGLFGLDLQGNQNSNFVIGNLVTSTNSSGAVHLSTMYGRTRILKSSLAEATKVAQDSAALGLHGYASFQNFNGTAGDHRTYYGHSLGATIFSEQTIRHTASGVAWKISPLSTTYVRDNVPVTMPVGQLYCNASAQVTVRIFMRRTNTGISGHLRCRGGQIAGVASDVIDAISVAADTWEELEITFTPSAAGLVEIDVQVWGGSTFSMYVDDMTYFQA